MQTSNTTKPSNRSQRAQSTPDLLECVYPGPLGSLHNSTSCVLLVVVKGGLQLVGGFAWRILLREERRGRASCGFVLFCFFLAQMKTFSLQGEPVNTICGCFNEEDAI